MSHLKKTLAIFLMVCMLASMMPVGTAFAAADGAAPTETTTGGAAPEGSSGGTPDTQSEGTMPDTPSEPSTPSTPGEEADPLADAGAGDACTHETPKTVPEVPATCTAPGKTEEIRCSTCDQLISGGDEIPALGHDWTRGPDQSVCSRGDATCTHKEADGTTKFDPKTGVCAGCGYTCEHKTADGKWNYDAANGKCKLCGMECTHKNGSKYAFEDTAEGSTTRICSICQYICGNPSHPEYDKWGYCKTCNYHCPHQKDGATTYTPNDEGKYVCGLCGRICPHDKWDYSDPEKAKCNECGKECNHKKADGGYNFDPATGKCLNGCKYTCLHGKVTNGQCELCKMTMVAKITKSGSSEVYYSDLNKAVAGAADGETILLLNNIEATSISSDVADRNVILNLNSFHLTLNNTGSFATDTISWRGANSSLTIKGGTVSSNLKSSVSGTGSILTIDSDVTWTAASQYAFEVKKDATLNIKGTVAAPGNVVLVSGINATANIDGTVKDGNIGVYVSDKSSGATVNVNGTITTSDAVNAEGEYIGVGIYVEAPNTKVNVNGSGSVSGGSSGVVVGKSGLNVGGTVVDAYGTLHGAYFALASNGACDGTTTFNVYNGATLTSGQTTIYQPNRQGTLNVTGGTITGTGTGTGIEVRGGTANISGGTITGGGTFGHIETANTGNGPVTKGAGLAVVQYATTDNSINVTISGGTFNAAHAIHEENVEPGLDIPASGTVNITITGNSKDLTLTGLVYSSDDRITFEGGESDRQMDVPTTPDATGTQVIADANCVHAGANNVIKTGAVKEAVIPKQALEECATEDYTIVTVDTDVASVSLDGKALKTINDAVTAADGSAIVHVEKLSETTDGKIYKVYVEDQDGNKIAAYPATLGDGSASVMLKDIATAPKQVRHYDANADNSYKFMETFGPSEFTYDADKDTVTVKITHFSYLATSMTEAPVAPEITTVDADLPTAYIGKEYPATKLDATGTEPITWSKDETTNAWPTWLTLDETTGTIKANGAVPPGTTDTTITVKAENAVGSVTKDFTIKVEEYVAARLYHEDNTLIDGYPSVQDAVDAAKALGGTEYYSVVVEENSPDENVLVEDANVIVIGLDPDGNAVELGSVTFGQGCEGGMMNVVTDKVTVRQNAYVYLSEGNNVKQVVNENTIGNVDNPDPNVFIDGGHYGSLSPAGSKNLKPAESGSYLVAGGTFEKEIPMEYCREIDENGNIIQRYAKYDSRTKRYNIVDFKFDITAVTNSGYHMPGSKKTLVFSTNLDYRLAARDRGDTKIAITTGRDSKVISGAYYDITKGPDDKAQITLSADTLNKLALGRYTLTYDGPTGKDSMYFHISNTVKTGDTSNIGLWMGIMGVSVVVLGAVAAVLVIKSKKKNGGAKKKDEK